MDLNIPGPVKSYDSKDEAYAALDDYRQQIRELLNLTSEELHETGPAEVERKLGEIGVRLIRPAQ